MMQVSIPLMRTLGKQNRIEQKRAEQSRADIVYFSSNFYQQSSIQKGSVVLIVIGFSSRQADKEVEA
jgi:hypothetical protein